MQVIDKHQVQQGQKKGSEAATAGGCAAMGVYTHPSFSHTQTTNRAYKLAVLFLPQTELRQNEQSYCRYYFKD